MPTLHLKNKVSCSLVNTVKQSLKIGGVPDYISLTPREGYQLLKEIQELKDVLIMFGFKQDDTKIDNDEPHLQFLLKKQDEETRRKILNRWYQNLYEITYLHIDEGAPQLGQTVTRSERNSTLIPLKIVNPKKETKDEGKDPSSSNN